MIGILDYGMGNIKSVINSLEFLGIKNSVVESPEEFRKISHLVIPGVGAFPKAMEQLRLKDFVAAIKDFALDGNPLLGICLGMQLLADQGFELEQTEGLGIISGEVEAFNSNTLIVPHMGWNGIMVENEHPILEGVKISADFYFVHSFYFKCSYSNNIIAKCSYGNDFETIIRNEKGNVIGVQFHPEKSQKQGLKILDNFSKLEKC